MCFSSVEMLDIEKNNLLVERELVVNGHKYPAVTLYAVPPYQIASPDKTGVNFIAVESHKDIKSTIALAFNIAVFIILVYVVSLKDLTIHYCKD